MKPLILALVLAAVAAPAHAQQQTRITCYDSGNTRICETFDRYGALLSKSRCYKSGRDVRCDTQNFGNITPAPFTRSQ
jgi:hypothetical protein